MSFLNGILKLNYLDINECKKFLKLGQKNSPQKVLFYETNETKSFDKSSLEDFENCWDYEIFENLGILAF